MDTGIPQVALAGHEISRLICGTNCFLGFSHMSEARDLWLKRYFTLERIVEVLTACSESGINAIVGPADPKLAEALKEHDRRTGIRLHWIATTYGDRELIREKEEIAWLAEQGAEYCLIQAGYTDSNLFTSEKIVKGLDELIYAIRKHGMAPGVSTHRPETLNVCEEAGYGLALYILPINIIGFLSPVETNWVSDIIKNTPKPVVAIKPLASGRVMPEDGLRFAFNAIKDTDVVAVGLMGPEEVKEDAALAAGILAGRSEKIGRPVTPSKKTLK